MRLLAALAILMALSGCMSKTLLVQIYIDGGSNATVTVSDNQMKPMDMDTEVGHGASVSIPLLP